MAKYVDGFVIAIKKNKVAQYKKMAKIGKKLWLKYGALDYVEAIGDDLKVKGIRSFTKTAKAKSNETVIFSYIVFKSKAHRNSVNKKVMNDPAMKNFDPSNCPFLPSAMSYGGFKVIVGS